MATRSETSSVFARLFWVALFAIGADYDTASARTATHPDVAAAAKWGLLGIWKIDCDAPTSQSNWRLSYVVKAGRLYHDRNSGKSKDSSRVTKVTITDDGILEITVNFRSFKQVRHFGFIRGIDGRIRAMFNRNVKTNEYTVRDGRFLRNHQATRWQTRCS